MTRGRPCPRERHPWRGGVGRANAARRAMGARRAEPAGLSAGPAGRPAWISRRARRAGCGGSFAPAITSSGTPTAGSSRCSRRRGGNSASLTVIEPPATAVARGRAGGGDGIRGEAGEWYRDGPGDPGEFLARVPRARGVARSNCRTAATRLCRARGPCGVERGPGRRSRRWRRLAAAPYPKLVVSGARTARCSTPVCDVLEAEGRERSAPCSRAPATRSSGGGASPNGWTRSSSPRRLAEPRRMMPLPRGAVAGPRSPPPRRSQQPVAAEGERER